MNSKTTYSYNQSIIKKLLAEGDVDTCICIDEKSSHPYRIETDIYEDGTEEITIVCKTCADAMDKEFDTDEKVMCSECHDFFPRSAITQYVANNNRTVKLCDKCFLKTNRLKSLSKYVLNN